MDPDERECDCYSCSAPKGENIPSRPALPADQSYKEMYEAMVQANSSLKMENNRLATRVKELYENWQTALAQLKEKEQS